MRINDFTPPLPSPSVDFNGGGDAPLPPEMPFEVQAAFSFAQLLDRSSKALHRHLDNMLKCHPQPAAEKMAEALLAGASAENRIADFVEQVQAKRIRSQMWAQQVCQCGALMSHGREALPLEQHQYLEEPQKFILRDLQDRFPPPAEIAQAFDQSINSSDDFFDKLLALIDLIKNGYLAGYEHILAAYSDFFSDFNKDITALLKDWVVGGGDGKEVTLNVGALRAALSALIDKYTHPKPGSVLFPKSGEDGTSREEADKWREALGLPESCLKQNADGTWCVVMDTGPLDIMLNGLPAGDSETWDTARFQMWQTGFNAQEERMKNMLQSLTQKYSNANAYHDNFNKVLSSHLSQYSDMLKAMLNF